MNNVTSYPILKSINIDLIRSKCNWDQYPHLYSMDVEDLIQNDVRLVRQEAAEVVE